MSSGGSTVSLARWGLILVGVAIIVYIVIYIIYKQVKQQPKKWWLVIVLAIVALALFVAAGFI